MSSLRIKNIGPIKDTGNVSLTHVMLIIGEQSSGKSTFMKILCYCRWFEKKVMIGDYKDVKEFTVNDFLQPLISFHRLTAAYFSDLSLIEYHGEALNIVLKGLKIINLSVTEHFDAVRHNTKLSYLPAERNLLSVIPELDAKYRSSTFDVMFNSVIEFNEANVMFSEKKPLKLSILKGMEYYHEGHADYVRFDEHHAPITLEYMSSGVQSTVPVSLMSKYLCEVTGAPSKRTPQTAKGGFSSDFSSDFERDRLSYYNYPQLFVEEPEQHLFPQAQANLIEEILFNQLQAFQKTNQMGYVFMTTHSPYVLSVINIFLLAGKLKGMGSLSDKVEKITNVAIAPNDMSIYSIENGRFVSRMDSDTGMIGGNYLDSVSEVMSDRFNKLYRLYVNEFAKK